VNRRVVGSRQFESYLERQQKSAFQFWRLQATAIHHSNLSRSAPLFNARSFRSATSLWTASKPTSLTTTRRLRRTFGTKPLHITGYWRLPQLLPEVVPKINQQLVGLSAALRLPLIEKLAYSPDL
jgi:hypothetical protein